MQAVLLAAGLGSRLGSLTERLPKALITVGGEPLLAYAVRFAQAAGAREILVVGGFGYELVAAEVARLGLPVELLQNTAFRDGNLVSLMAARPKIGKDSSAEDFLVMNVDHIYKRPIAALAGAPVGEITAFIDTDRTLGDDDMKVERDEQGRVRRISKTLTTFDAGYVGMTKIPGALSGRYWAEADAALATEGRAIHVERVLARLADGGNPPACRDISGHGWLEVDLPEERDRAEQRRCAREIGDRAVDKTANFVRRHKVLLFIPNLQQGGAERQILELMTKLPPRFETTLCLYEDVVHYRDYLPAGEPRNVLGTPRMGRRGLGRLVEVLQRERPDILHSYRDKANFWARLAVRRAPVPVVITAVRSRAMSLLHLLTEWYLSRLSDRVIANSEGVRRELVSLARVRPEKIQVLHNFIDLEKFRLPSVDERKAARARWQLGDDEIALLLPGRIGLQKNQIGLALALARLARAGRLPANLRILLAGRKRDRLYAMVLPRVLSLLGLTARITFLGSVSEMASLYHAADALVLPSLWEGLPNAVLEAQASGLPAVVSHAANIDMLVVDGESGFEVPTLDIGALAEAIARMVALDDDARRAMGRHGRDHVAVRFGPDRVLAETVRLYDELLAVKGRA